MYLGVPDEDLGSFARGRLHAHEPHPLARHLLELPVGSQKLVAAQKALWVGENVQVVVTMSIQHARNKWVFIKEGERGGGGAARMHT